MKNHLTKAGIATFKKLRFINAHAASVIRKMKNILTFVLLFISSEGIGCIISPFQMVADQSEKLLESADVAFFGKLVLLETGTNGKQVATFLVIKHYKDNDSAYIEVKNESLSSCFRSFSTIDSAYYIFAKKVIGAEQYEITSSLNNGFMPLEYAVKYDISMP